jgi:hypothetical protein
MLFLLGNYNSFSVFPPFTFFLEIAKMVLLMEFLDDLGGNPLVGKCRILR